MSDLKAYDVTFTISVSGYEKEGLCRVHAENSNEAIYEAVVAEVHNLSDEEVREWWEGDNFCIEDGDCMLYQDFKVVALFPVEVVVGGVSMTAFLPKDNNSWIAGGRYFE
ncbi:MAG: hypothetical protein ACTIJH_11875 [Moraxellaceae bacterium]